MWSLINSVFGSVSDALLIRFISAQDSAGLSAEGSGYLQYGQTESVSEQLVYAENNVEFYVLIVTSES